MSSYPGPPTGKIGKYIVEKVLGRGAMGVVYLARDPQIERSVAVKTIALPQGLDDDKVREFRGRFLLEARAAGRLNHPAIVTVYEADSGQWGGPPFIAMEYIEGEAWNRRIKAGIPKNVEDVLILAREIASALEYAHKNGIIHRDIKPANIIETNTGRVKLMDFGIAKVPSSELTREGQFLGTPAYMSPEQVMGKTVDGRSDLFSLGTVLYEVLTARKPFAGEDIPTVTHKILREEPTPPSSINPEIVPEVEAILKHLLAKDPAQRYENAGQLIDDLDAYLAGATPPHAGALIDLEAAFSATFGGVPLSESTQPFTPAEVEASGSRPEIPETHPPQVGQSQVTQTAAPKGPTPSDAQAPAAGEPASSGAPAALRTAPLPPAGKGPAAKSPERGRRVFGLGLWSLLAVPVLLAAAALGVHFGFRSASARVLVEPPPVPPSVEQEAPALPEGLLDAPVAQPARSAALPTPPPKVASGDSGIADMRPTAIEVPKAPAPCKLHFVFTTRVVKGEFWLMVDGAEVYHQAIDRDTFSKETYTGAVHIPSGKRTLAVRVKTVRQNVDSTWQETVEFPEGGEKNLRIVLTTFNKNIRFEWP